MWKKGHVRRNWTERWFVLKPSSIAYYISEDLKDKKGEIKLDKTCVVEVGEGMFIQFCMFMFVLYGEGEKSETGLLPRNLLWCCGA